MCIVVSVRGRVTRGCALVSQISCCHNYILNTTNLLSCQSGAATDA